MVTIIDFKIDVRNMLYLIGFLYAVLALVMLYAFVGTDKPLFLILFILFSLTTVLFVISANDCAKGKRWARVLGLVLSAGIVLNIPFGTILGISALIKLNKKEFIDSLQS